MSMSPEVIATLDRQEIDPDGFHDKLLKHVKGLVDMSRSAMSQYYSEWDERQRIYRARTKPDKEDRNAERHKEPVKSILPITYAQIDTFVAFCFLLLRQRQYLYEFEASGQEDYTIRDAGEALLDRDMRENKQAHLLYQYLVDVARFGMGCTKVTWVEEPVWLQTMVQQEQKTVLGETIPDVSDPVMEWTKFVKFEGNRVINVSPYRVFPDTRLPLSRYQEGEFVATEDTVAKTALLKGQKAKLYCGVQWIEPFSVNDAGKRQEVGSRLDDIKWNSPGDWKSNCVTEVIVDLVPSDWKMDDTKSLGDQSFPIRHIVTYVNDKRIIRCEPLNQIAPNFPVFIGQFCPDMHELVNQSLAEIISRLQEIIDWFVNSRVASVKRTLDNQLVVDPSGIEMATVNNRSRVILMKKAAARTGVDRYLKQLNVSDVTAHHMADALQFSSMTQTASGVNDNAMGQYNSGRRSAYESRVVTQGSAARMRKVVELQWEATFQPQGTTMLINHRQNVSEDTFRRVVGEDATPELFAQFKADTNTLVQNNDLFVFDGSLPSEKAFVAQALQELLGIVLSNPNAAVQFNLDPKQLLTEIYSLQGVGKLDRFGFSQMEQMKQQLMLALTQQQNAPARGTESQSSSTTA